MTTERFMIDDAGELIDLNTHKFVDYGDEVCNLLNGLHEKKEDAITKKEDAEYELLHLKEKYEELLEENEQLKQQEKRLYDYFRKCFDNVSEEGFQETWEVVKKYD